jgi:hypothetical protein
MQGPDGGRTRSVLPRYVIVSQTDIADAFRGRVKIS